MRFSFNVKLTDEDYLLFNEFTLKNSGMSKRGDLLSKILVSIIFLVSCANLLITDGITPVSVVGVIILCLLGLIFLLCSKKFNTVFTKAFTRFMLKGKAKKPYTPESALEFYDDFFKEIAPDNKTESNYTAIDKICVVMNSYIFIFIDSIRGYVIPFTSFKDAEEEKAFLAFLGTLTPDIQFFDKI